MTNDETALKLDLLLGQFLDIRQFKEDAGKFDEDESFSFVKPRCVKNKNQRLLRKYFAGRVSLSASIAEAYDTERNSDRFSEAVLADYIKKSGRRVKDLLCFMLRCYPAEIDLLCDLTFLHQFYPILKTLIYLYTKACVMTDDLEDFELLTKNFQRSVELDGFDALTALKQETNLTPDKMAIVERLILSERNQQFLDDAKTIH